MKTTHTSSYPPDEVPEISEVGAAIDVLVAGGQAGQRWSDVPADAEAEDFYILGLQAVGEG